MLRDLRTEYRELARFYGEREARKLLPFGWLVDVAASTVEFAPVLVLLGIVCIVVGLVLVVT